MSPQSPSDDPEIAPMLALCRIIAAALVLGVVSFTAVTIVLRLGKQPEAGELLSLLAAFFAAVAIVVRQVVLGLMSGRAIPHNNEPTVPASLRLFQTRMIVGLALLEGAALFNLVAFMTEGHWWTLIVVAVLLVWMLASFPTHGRLKQWIEDREQLKSLGSNIT